MGEKDNRYKKCILRWEKPLKLWTFPSFVSSWNRSASNLAKITFDLMTYCWFSENYKIKGSIQWNKGYFSCFNKNKGIKGLRIKLKAIKGSKGFKGSPGKPATDKLS